LVGTLGVVDVVERVDLGLELHERVGERLLVEVAEQGLMEAFVLALGCRLVGRAGDRLGAQRGNMCDRDRVLGGLTGCDMGGDMGGEGVAEVVVDELEDHALASAGQDVLGGVELPARVRGRVDEPPPRRARLLLRLPTSDTGLTEDPR
jgi:hypothetical protein